MISDEEIQRLAADFGLGQALEVCRLVPGTDRAIRLTTSSGMFVLKRAHDVRHLPVLAEAAEVLTDRGLPHPRLRLGPTGQVASDGWFAQEYLQGDAVASPTLAQTAAAMRYLGGFLAALSHLPNPGLPISVWVELTDPIWLVENALQLASGRGLAAEQSDAIEAATELVAERAEQFKCLPQQLVHGDIGPDQFLWAGADVASLVDFTPFWESALFAVAGALYWFDIRRGADAAVVIDHFSLVRRWSTAERQLLPYALLREALRRVATPLAKPPPTDLADYLAPRVAGLQATLAMLTQLTTSDSLGSQPDDM